MYPSASNEISSSAAASTTHRQKASSTAASSRPVSLRASTNTASRSQNVDLNRSSSGSSQDSPEKILSPTLPIIQQLKNLYCCNIPDNMMDRDLLRAHFQQFGRVVRIYLSMKRNSCTVHFDSHSAAALAKLRGASMNDSTLKIFWSQPAKNSGKSKDNSSNCSISNSPSQSEAQERKFERVKRRSEDLPNENLPNQIYTRLRSHTLEKRLKASSSSVQEKSKNKVRHLLQSRKGKNVKALGRSKEEDARNDERKSPYSIVRKAYEMPEEVKDELKVMAGNDDILRMTDSPIPPFDLPAFKIPRGSNSVPVISTSSDVPLKKAPVLRDIPEGRVYSSSNASIKRIRKSAIAAAPGAHQLSALQELVAAWNTKSRQENHSAEDRYQLLELRDKILRLKRGKQSDLSTAVVMQGTCQDMCPEKERYQRESRHQVAIYEYLATASKDVVMDHTLAVKQYSRSSADQEEPLPHDLRPPHILRMAMDYLLVNIMDRCDNGDENLGDWYHFLWDRTRGIRKDITQQELCNMDAVTLIEQCTRFHIHCSERLVAEDTSVFDNKINSENLTKCLQTLKYMYHDISLKGIACPNEAEFRGYIILLNLNDANFMWELKELSTEIINSEPVRFAIEVSLALSMDNYVRFFNLVRYTTYLNACILLRYFHQVRSKALFTVVKSHCSGNKQSLLSLKDLTRWFAFENMRDTALFCDHYGLRLTDNNAAVLCKDSLHNPAHRLPVGRAISLIESKRTCSVGEVVNGGPLASDTFEDYQPHSSFNTNGTVNQKTVDAISEIVNLEASKSSHKTDTLESDVPDDVARMREMEKIRYQEQAMEEAETWKSNEMMQDMLSEIIQEELGVFSDRLTNVSLLEMDELMLDVTCNLTREIYKDVVVKEEEVAKQAAEAIAKQKEEERQKLIDVKAEEFFQEFLDESVTDFIKEVCEEEEEFHSSCLQQMEIVVNEVTMEIFQKMMMDVIRKKRFQFLSQKQHIAQMRKCFNIWKNFVRRSKLYRKCMAEFPAWISTLSLEQQIANLEKPQTIGKTIKKFAVPEHAMEAMNKIPLFDIVSCELYINPMRWYSVEKYFKMVVSVPDEDESPKYGWFIREYTERVFSTNKDSDALNQPVPLLLERKLLFAASKLAISVRRLVGLDMIEGGVSNPEAMAGTNGLIFFICHDSVSIEHTKKRLHEVMKAKHHYGGIPVVFLVTDYLSKEEMNVGLNIEALMHNTGIRIGGVFHRKPNCPTGLEDMVCKAIFWLAQNSDDVPLPYCTTAENMVHKYLTDPLWERFKFYENTNEEVAGIKMDLESVIHVHNRSCNELLKIVTEETLNRCTIGAPEFKQYISPVQLNDCASNKLYEVMPPYFGSPEYKHSLVKILTNAQFKPVTKWPPKNPKELNSFMMEYCLQNDIPAEGFTEAFSLIVACLRHYDVDDAKPNWSGLAMNYIPWITVVKLLFKYKLRELDFKDHLHRDEGEHEIMVAMNREKISTFIESQWLHFLHDTKNKVMFCPPIEQQTAVCDSSEDGKEEFSKKRKSDEDSFKKKKCSKQLLFMDIQNVNTALQKLSGWLDQCSSKQQELGQKLQMALSDRNFIRPEETQ